MGSCTNQIKSNQINTYQIKCWFLRRGENRSTRRKTSRSREENQQTQPTYDAESENRTRATLVGGECSHHCAIPAPKFSRILFLSALTSSPCTFASKMAIFSTILSKTIDSPSVFTALSDCFIVVVQLCIFLTKKAFLKMVTRW